MRNLFFIAVIGLVSLLSGCGENNGKYAGIWERNNGRWIKQYEITKKDNGYKVLLVIFFRESRYRTPQSLVEAYRRSIATRNEQPKRGSGSEPILAEWHLNTVVKYFFGLNKL